MACACSKNRRRTGAAPAGTQYVYDFTAPGQDAVKTYGTPLEAKTAVRKHGGGVIRRRSVNTESGSAA